MLDGQDIADALDGAVRGDEASFAVLWRALNPPLLRYLRVLIPGACEDVASETWLQASRDLGGFTGDAKQFQVWLFRIARNRAIDEGRRNQRQLDEPVAALPEQRAGDDTAEAALAAMATRRALAVIADLPRDQAEAVLLRAVAGLSADQAGAVVGKRAGAVRVAAMRGLRTLKKRLDKAAEPEKAQVKGMARTGSRAGVTR
jgi:RNA polymerase sigma-70 factor (ECF subfamily)